MFAGPGDRREPHRRPVWLLAGAALALQTMRHAIDFSYPRLAAPGDAPQRRSRRSRPVRRHAPGVAVPGRSSRRRSRTRRRRRSPPRARALTRGACAALWRAIDRYAARSAGSRRSSRFPIGERFAAISITAALFDARVDVHRAARLGRLRAADVHGRPGGCCGRSGERGALDPAARPDRPRACSTPTATTGRSPRALGRALGRAHPAAADRAAARRRRCRCWSRSRVTGDGASWWLVGRRGRLARAAAAGSRAGARCTTACAGSVPPALRAIEYAGLLWIGARRRRRRACRPRSRCCARSPTTTTTSSTGCRHRGVARRRAGSTPPAGGWDGRLLARRRARSPPARCRPASTSRPRCSRSLFVAETVARAGGASDARRAAGLRRRGGGGRLIGMVLAAGAGRRLEPLHGRRCPRRCVPVDGDRTILDIALGNLRRAGLGRRSSSSPATRPSAVEERKAALEERHGVRARARLQPEGGGVEQRLLAVVRARALRARACCSSTATRCTRPSVEETAAGRAAAPTSCSRSTTPSRSARRR